MAARHEGASASTASIGGGFAPPVPQFAAPAVSLPPAGGAIRGIGETFGTNAFTGTAGLTVPIATSPGRSGFGPALALAYDSGNGNGPFGAGWTLSMPVISRRTERGLPRYDDTDVFLLSGAEDLVPVLEPDGLGGWRPVTATDPPHAPGFRIDRFRPRTEGLFARIERWTRRSNGDVHWRSISRDGVTHRYGERPDARIADPDDPGKVFSWLLCRSDDGTGNAIVYDYLADGDDGVDVGQAHERHRTSAQRTANRYLKRIRYGNRVSTRVEPDPEPDGWLFEVVLDYGDHGADVPTPAADRSLPARAHPFSSYRAGFEIRDYRLCRRVLVFHHVPDEPAVGAGCLVRATEFGYLDRGAAGEFLATVTQRGYRRRAAGGYHDAAMPPLEFAYSSGEFRGEVLEIDAGSVANLPAGSAAAGHQWADLDGDGIAGILATGTDAWYYTPNLGAGRLGAMREVPGMPSPAVSTPARPRLLDLDGDGRLEVVTSAGAAHGRLARTADGGWEPWQPFPYPPAVDLDAPDVTMVDVDGDGLADILVLEGDRLTWYPSAGCDGFGPGITLPTGVDDDAGPRLLLSGQSYSVHLADMSGDGLADLVRIGNGEVCYYPNLGYGRFGARVAMDAAPWFDSAELFDPGRLRLADVFGSGVTDVLYLATDGIRLYLNDSGNGFVAYGILPGLPPPQATETVQTVDLLGAGTACLVWSSTHPDDAGRSMRYADLTGGVKPHLLERVINNLGAETVIRYASSTRFCLADAAAGRPWLTRLPFPVQLVERVETLDRISGNRFVRRFAYHHGFFDGIDREFRGFGMTEQWDTEELSAIAPVDLTGPEPAANLDPASHVPPVLTRTWAHTGAFAEVAGGDLAAAYASEFWTEPAAAVPAPSTLPATVLLADGTRLPHRPDTEELREAYRALRGAPLRQEVYALDGSAEQDLPYTVTSTSYGVELLQPAAGQRHAVCLRRPAETVTASYERARDPDPRIGHEVALDVDGYGNVTRGVSVVYPRRRPGADLDPRLPSWAADAVLAAQETPAVVVTSNRFTNAVDDAAAYRSPMIAESHAEELTGVETAPPALLRLEELRALADGTLAAGRRSIRRSRVRYRADDLSGPLPLGALESLGLPYRTEHLAVTDALLDTVLRRDGVPLLSDPAAVLGEECGYLPDDDGTWWAPSGQAVFGASAGTDFYLPDGFTDPYGNTTTVGYDRYRLLPVEVTDALGNTVSAANDYRVLAPVRLTDPNGAVSEATFDALGMVAATARRGRPGDPRGSTLNGVDPDPADTAVAAYLADPVGAAAALLGGASTRLVYDLFAYTRTSGDAQPQAPVTATLARESYDGEPTRIAQALAYSDGFGRALQAKALAAGGRWVASGWTIVNNKGLPVRQYEPFFTATHRFEPDVRAGVSPIVCYDPVGRVVATVHPDRSWAKVAFDAWRQDSWDGCDTVLTTDPRTDPDVGGYLARLPVEDVLPTWYMEHATDAAADAHADTPAQAYLDPMGRTVLTVTHNRVPGGSADLLQPTLVVLDVEGNQGEVVDALGRSAARYDYDLAGQVLHSASPDAGQRWALGDATGRPRYAWNSRGMRHRSTYDVLLRPAGLYLDDGGGPETLVARTEYGESLERAAAAAAYLLGRAHQVCDGAGRVTTAAYDFAGNPITVTRRLVADQASVPDWSGAVALSDESFVTVTAYDALDRPVLTTAPDGSRVRPVYDEAGLLTGVDVALAGMEWAPYVTGIAYTAKGQRERISYGNGTVSEYEYDRLTQRLASTRTVRAGELLQDLAYSYDAVGNVVRVADSAQQTVFFRNTVVEPSADYTYDATYQLVAASGREHLGQLGDPVPPGPFDIGAADQPGDGLAVGRYTEAYGYDAAGNILAVRHRGSDPAHPGWTRRYAYPDRNRLASTRVGSGPVETYAYDEHGSMTSMPHLPLMVWNHADQLRATARQVVNDGLPETTWYGYDGGGQRVRWVTLRSAGPEQEPTRKCERIYVGGFEVYREYDGSGTTVTLERVSLSVLDGTKRIALAERRTAGDDGTAELLVRFQLGNHLGSACLELDADGRVISYEDYHPYGSTSYQAVDRSVRAAAKRYRFTGMERDVSTGLEYHSARYYAPWLARWTAADPAGFVDGPNLFRYTRNNPVNATDPSGTTTLAELPENIRPPDDQGTPLQLAYGLSVRLKEGTFQVQYTGTGGSEEWHVSDRPESIQVWSRYADDELLKQGISSFLVIMVAPFAAPEVGGAEALGYLANEAFSQITGLPVSPSDLLDVSRLLRTASGKTAETVRASVSAVADYLGGTGAGTASRAANSPLDDLLSWLTGPPQSLSRDVLPEGVARTYQQPGVEMIEIQLGELNRVWVSTTEILFTDVSKVVEKIRSYSDAPIDIVTGRHGRPSGHTMPWDRFDQFAVEDLLLRKIPNVNLRSAWNERGRIGEIVTNPGPRHVILAWCYSDVTREAVAQIAEQLQQLQLRQR
ncbi:MAG TPA: SpvB/TcaC N-terminal domain-containing protein [Pilimelia sp.]|nr:SpvB/TcaC N-terminal domain-containing protein [Pilimelia sp.]